MLVGPVGCASTEPGTDGGVVSGAARVVTVAASLSAEALLDVS